MPKLAIWRVIRAAYRFVFGQPFQFLRAVWPWIVLQGAFLMLPVYNTSAAPRISPMFSVLCSLVVFMLLIASFVSGSVAIHRSIMLRESSWWTPLRFARREWRFLGSGIVIALSMFVPLFGFQIMLMIIVSVMFPKVAPLTKNSAITIAIFGIYFGAISFIWGFVNRLMLALPAVAVDEEGEQLNRAWNRTRGNTLRLWFGSVACWIPFATLFFAAMGYVVWTRQVLTFGDGWIFGLSLLGLIINVFSAATLIAFYSYAFLELADASMETSSPQPVGMPGH